jgi:hypothetical protein
VGGLLRELLDIAKSRRIVGNHSNKCYLCYHSDHGRNNENKLSIVLGLSQCDMKERHMELNKYNNPLFVISNNDPVWRRVRILPP